jgi:drug/metabolite transporter (DMT)-like permease
MMVLLMFSAMVPAIFVHFISESFLRPEQRTKLDTRTMINLIVPCVCDLTCTLFLLVAQVYLTASLWQMMRGSVIVFTALLKRFVLQSKLRIHMWLGIFVM